VIFEKKPILDPQGNAVKDLFAAWIILNNPAQYNSYTTEMVKGVIAGFQRASADNSVVAATAGVTKDVKPGTVVSGFPAREHHIARRLWALTAQLPDMAKRVKELERMVEELRKGVTVDSSAEDDR